MNIFNTLLAAAAIAVPSVASAALISVVGPNSTAGTAAEIIAAPSDVLDDLVVNSGMQGFDEAQGVVAPTDFFVDGGTIAAGTVVNSHMIFLNSSGGTRIEHLDVTWTFDATILGVMSDVGGTLEAATSSFLGAAGTNYTVPIAEAAPFSNRGLEGGGDAYSFLSPNQLQVSMVVTEPGDWIRVVTEAAVVPVPAGLPLILTGLGALAIARRARRKA
jgi:hypothetical protein